MAKVKKNSKLQFSKGDYVVYPSYGPGRILAIKKVVKIRAFSTKKQITSF